MTTTVNHSNTPLKIALITDTHNHGMRKVVTSLKIMNPEIICIVDDFFLYLSSGEWSKKEFNKKSPFNSVPLCYFQQHLYAYSSLILSFFSNILFIIDIIYPFCYILRDFNNLQTILFMLLFTTFYCYYLGEYTYEDSISPHSFLNCSITKESS